MTKQTPVIRICLIQVIANNQYRQSTDKECPDKLGSRSVLPVRLCPQTGYPSFQENLHWTPDSIYHDISASYSRSDGLHAKIYPRTYRTSRTAVDRQTTGLETIWSGYSAKCITIEQLFELYLVTWHMVAPTPNVTDSGAVRIDIYHGHVYRHSVL